MKLLTLLLLLASNAAAFDVVGSLPQGLGDGRYVQKAGDTMSGPLTLNGSTLTVTGNAFSVGGSTFMVTGGKVTIGGNSSTLPKLEVGGNILVNSVGAGLDIYAGHYNPADGSMALTIGGDLGNVIRSATSRKSAVINSPSYTLSGHPTLMFWQDNNTTTSDLLIGGGNGYQYASTHIGLFTAANNTTDAGTERLTILSGGNVGIGTTAPAQKLEVAGNVLVSSGTLMVEGTGAAFQVAGSTFTVSGGFTIHNVQNKATINAMNGVLGGVVTCSDCTNTYTLCVGTGTAKGAFREVGTATNCN